MSCNTCQPPSSNCTPFVACPPENYGGMFPSLVGPPGPAGGQGTFVENLAALRLIGVTTLNQGYIAQVGGHTTPFDGGGGLFAYNAGAADADNDGTIVRPVSGIGRWYRIFSGGINVRWFGVNSSGVASATNNTRVANAVAAVIAAGGGSLIFNGGGTFRFSGYIVIAGDDVEIDLGANTTIEGYQLTGQQIPFGSLFVVQGERCSFVGQGPSSLIAMVGGSTANAITFLHRGNGLVMSLAIDGGKDSVASIVDDTFETGISIINATGTNPSPTKGRFRVIGVACRNFGHYGITLFGDLVSYSQIEATQCYDNGVLVDANSVGTGIAVNAGVNNVTFTGVQCWGNKRHGYDISSAGVQQNAIEIIGGFCRDNGSCGIVSHEEATFGSIVNVGQNGLTITGGFQAISNGTHGINVATADNVGVIQNVVIGDVIARDNLGYGILIQSNDVATGQTVSQGVIDGAISRDNVNDGVTLATFVRNFVVRNTIAVGNGGTQINDFSGLNDTEGLNHTTSGNKFYTSGTFTPTIIGSTAAGVGTYTTQEGKYTRIGNRVFFVIRLVWTAHTGTGNMSVAGLPISSLTETPVPILATGLDATVTDIRGRTQGGGTEIPLLNFDLGNFATIPIEAAGTVFVSGQYDTTFP